MAERPLIIFPNPELVDVPTGRRSGGMPPAPLWPSSRIQRFQEKFNQ